MTKAMHVAEWCLIYWTWFTTCKKTFNIFPLSSNFQTWKRSPWQILAEMSQSKENKNGNLFDLADLTFLTCFRVAQSDLDTKLLMLWILYWIVSFWVTFGLTNSIISRIPQRRDKESLAKHKRLFHLSGSSNLSCLDQPSASLNLPHSFQC